jgi:hypothetical protein
MIMALGLVASVLILGVITADPPKDTPSAAHTRTKKLKTKVTLEYKNEMLREILADIAGQIENAGLNKLSVAYANGVNMNMRLSVNVKDKTVEEALEELLKPAELGYVVVSKDKDRYDGWIRITKGNERGFELGTDTKGTETKKEDPKKEVTRKEDPKKEDPKDPPKTDEEKVATGKLGLAKLQISGGKPEKAVPILEEIVNKFPMTKAAEEAKKLLEKYKK